MRQIAAGDATHAPMEGGYVLAKDSHEPSGISHRRASCLAKARLWRTSAARVAPALFALGTTAHDALGALAPHHDSRTRVKLVIVAALSRPKRERTLLASIRPLAPRARRVGRA